MALEPATALANAIYEGRSAIGQPLPRWRLTPGAGIFASFVTYVKAAGVDRGFAADAARVETRMPSYIRIHALEASGGKIGRAHV